VRGRTSRPGWLETGGVRIMATVLAVEACVCGLSKISRGNKFDQRM
jgi:hypothetical protein